jgi:hypothetical protein
LDNSQEKMWPCGSLLYNDFIVNTCIYIQLDWEQVFITY